MSEATSEPPPGLAPSQPDLGRRRCSVAGDGARSGSTRSKVQIIPPGLAEPAGVRTAAESLAAECGSHDGGRGTPVVGPAVPDGTVQFEMQRVISSQIARPYG